MTRFNFDFDFDAEFETLKQAGDIPLFQSTSNHRQISIDPPSKSCSTVIMRTPQHGSNGEGRHYTNDSL
jgi:hypothetical protein